MNNDTVWMIACTRRGTERMDGAAAAFSARHPELPVRTAVFVSFAPERREEKPLREFVGEIFPEAKALVFFSAAGIAVRAVGLMQSEYGCRPAGIKAYINPSILDCCFEVEDDVVSQFANVLDVSKYCRKTGIKNGRQKYHMDTAAINRDALIKAGLLPEHVMLSGVCTVCRHDEFHSYRADAGADGKFGLNGSIICLK